jgi:hypothetical protein
VALWPALKYSINQGLIMNDELKIIEKLRLIEALFSGATTDGERDAAANALQRMRDRLQKVQEIDPPVEYKFTMADMWSRKLFVALLRRYDIKPYRFHRQRYTTVMARVSQKFVDETLWPEFVELDKTLQAYLNDITNRVISESIHSDSTEAEIVRQLPEG